MTINKLILALLISLTTLQASDWPQNQIEMPEIKTEHVAGGAAAAAIAGAGIYAYHKSYVAPNLKTIDEAIGFTEWLLNDPFGWYTSKAGTQLFDKSDEFLNQQQEIVLRALGLTQSFTNLKTYIAYKYLSGKPQELLAQVDALFTKLKTVTEKTVNDLKKESQLDHDIKKDAATIYIELLQMRNIFDNKTLQNQVDKALENIENHQKILDGINDSYKKIIEEIIVFIEKPYSFHCSANKCTAADVQRMKKEISDLEQKVVGMIPGSRLFASKKRRDLEAAINNLFKLIRDNIYAEDEITKKHIQASARTCIEISASMLPINDLWTIVENSIMQPFEKANSPMEATGDDDSYEDVFSEPEEEPDKTKLLTSNPWADTKPLQEKRQKTFKERGFTQMKGKWVMMQGDRIYDEDGNVLDPKTLKPIKD